MEKEVGTLALAYLGDAVLEIHIRNYAISMGKTKIDQLHKFVVKYVSAKAQSYVYDKMSDMLSEKELTILKKGRNAKKNIPKNVEMVDYRKSTGVEALLGHLYLNKDNDRLEEIINHIIRIIEGRESSENRTS